MSFAANGKQKTTTTTMVQAPILERRAVLHAAVTRKHSGLAIHSAQTSASHHPHDTCRGIADATTKEMASLSVEEAHPHEELICALFDVPLTPQAVAAWIDREHEYKFVAIQSYRLDGSPEERMAVCTFPVLGLHHAWHQHCICSSAPYGQHRPSQWLHVATATQWCCCNRASGGAGDVRAVGRGGVQEAPLRA